MDEYTPKVIVQGTWGSGTNQFGKAIVEGDEVIPEILLMDSAGTFYVLDVVNNRVQVITSDGRFIRSINVESFRMKEDNKRGIGIILTFSNEMYLDSSERRLYVVTKRANKEYSVNGEYIRRVMDEELLKNIRVATAQLKVDGKGYTFTLQQMPDGMSQVLKIVGKETRIIPLPQKRVYEYIGSDSRGNAYMLEQRKREIIACSINKAEPIRIIKLKNQPYYISPDASKPVVDAAGNIYIMDTVKDKEHNNANASGMKIVKFTRKSFHESPSSAK
jgi:hypothetical protein